MVILHYDELYRINIRDYLIHRAHAVRVDAKGNLMNLAVLSEDFYAEFLNLLFDLHLKNANADKSNTAGIDLIDLENHVAVQVSLTCAPETIRRKIRASMRKFDKPDDKIWQFYFVPITDEAPELKNDFSLPESLVFDKDHDVLDIARLLTLASDNHKLSLLSQLVDQYSKKESDYQVLRNSLNSLLLETWKNHRSYKLMHTDDIDWRLFPGIKDGKQFEALGKRKENETESPVWSIIRDSWNEPENHPVMIQGKGGIGKTVTLFSVTDMDKDLLPAPAAYVPMFELIDKNGEVINLTNFFQTSEPFASLPEVQREGICSLASQSWNHGPSLLVLLDGFNEIPGDKRWDVLKMLQKWHTANMGAQLIAVSRPMDNLRLENAFGDSTITITLSELKRESVEEYLVSLNTEGIRIPEPESSAWDTIIYPLFLTLYIKSERLREQHLWKGYPMLVRDVTGPGSLIWNYLQRELLRQENEGWILRCALACEFIVPKLAYHMLKDHNYTVSQSEAVSIIQGTVSELTLEHMTEHLTKIISWWKRQHFSTDPPYFLKDYNWPEFVLQETGLLAPYRSSKEEQCYEFFHQSFRDCLAGLYLVNEAETAGNNDLPTVWRHGQNHLALEYAAELIGERTANRLWEINRRKMQYDSPGYMKDHSGTLALLELQKRRKPLPKNLNFSGMDLQKLSLARYIGIEKSLMHLFQVEHLTCDTKLDESTFQSNGHSSSISCMSVLSDGRVVSGSKDNSLRVWDTSTGQCLQILEGHRNSVNCIAVLPDGRVVSGSKDNSLRVWDTSTGQCLQVLEGHYSSVSCIAVLPDGRVVSGSDDSSLRVWDTSTGQCLQVMKEHHGWGHFDHITCIAALPDGRVVSGSDSGSLCVWDTSTGQCLQVIGHRSNVTCIAILPDGCVVSSSFFDSLRVWDPSTGQCLQVMGGHRDPVICIAVLPDGRFVSGSNGGSLVVWDPSTGRCLQDMGYRNINITCIAVLPDGRIISGSRDSTLRVWDPLTGQCLQVLEGHRNNITCIAVLPDKRVVSGAGDNSLRVWDPFAGQCLLAMEGHRDSVTCIAVLSDSCVVSGTYAGSLRVWDTSTGQCLQVLEGHRDSVRCIAVLPDRRVVSGSDDNSLRVWDPLTGQCLQVLEGHRNSVSCIAVLPDGHIVSGSYDDSLRVWDTSTGQCLQVLEGHRLHVICIAVLPDGRVVSGARDNSLRVWDISTGQCLQVLEGHRSPVGFSVAYLDSVRCIEVLPDGHVISVAGKDSLRVWDSSTGRCLNILEWDHSYVFCIAVLPDGQIVSGTNDGFLRVWDSSTRQCLLVKEKHRGAILCIAALSDGRVVSGSYDHSLRVWDTSTGQCLHVLRKHCAPVRCIAVLPDGQIVSGSDDNSLCLWNPNTGECKKTIEFTAVNVSQMDLSSAILPKNLAKLLWKNGAKISDADYENYVRSSNCK